MKLAFCLFKYFPYGGLQRDFIKIAKACHDKGHEIHVFTTSWEGEDEPDFNIHFIKPIGWQNHTRMRSFADQLAVELQKRQFDKVIGFNKLPNLDFYYAADVCYQARIHQARSKFYRLSARYKHYLALEKAVFAKGNKTQILLISPKQQAEFTRYYQTESERFHLLPPGISRDRQPGPHANEIRLAVRKRENIPTDHFLLLMVGSGFKTKGVDRSLRALAALPAELKAKCHLKIIGQDNPASFIKLAKELNISAQTDFLGGRKDVPDFLLAADLLLHPAYHENTGTVLLEAVVAGLPVLTVDVCGYAHYIENAQAGCVLSSPFEQTAFNALLEKMLSSNDMEKWRQNGIAFGKEADIYSLAERTIALIENTSFAVVSATPKQAEAVRLDAELLSLFSNEKPLFDQIMQLSGNQYRHQDGRRTQRLILNNQPYFIKQHHGVGWKEIFKNIMQLRLPIISAKNEWRAIQKLNELQIGVPTIVGYGEKGINPAQIKSFVLMKELSATVSLEDVCKDWKTSPPRLAFKHKLLREVAKIAKVMHAHGINHRDFYLCHFLIDAQSAKAQQTNFNLYLIDLHRAQMRHATPTRWLIKDLASLYFSSTHIGLTKRDLLRFVKAYSEQSLRDTLLTGKVFWEKVEKRGNTYRDHTK